MKTSRLFFLALIPVLFLAAALNVPAAESEEGPTAVSPDKKFVLRKVRGDEKGAVPENVDGQVTFAVIEAMSNKFVATDAGSTLSPIKDAIECVWAADSKHFAVNSRCGGRYEITQQYEFDGKKFKLMADIEQMMIAKLDDDRKAKLKALKLPANTYLRRIWDTFKTLRWIDASTIEVSASSTRSYIVDEKTEDTADLESEFVFIIKFDKKGKPQITSQKKPAKE